MCLTSRRNPRASALSFNALRAMSALLCGGPVFTNKVLDKDSTLYRWLENMLSSGESKVTTCIMFILIIITLEQEFNILGLFHNAS